MKQLSGTNVNKKFRGYKKQQQQMEEKYIARLRRILGLIKERINSTLGKE